MLNLIDLVELFNDKYQTKLRTAASSATTKKHKSVISFVHLPRSESI